MSEKKRFLLRLDPKLYEVLEKWSADELRSVNSQIEYILKETARKAGRWNPKKHYSDAGTSVTQTSTQGSMDRELQETSEDDTNSS